MFQRPSGASGSGIRDPETKVRALGLKGAGALGYIKQRAGPLRSMQKNGPTCLKRAQRARIPCCRLELPKLHYYTFKALNQYQDFGHYSYPKALRPHAFRLLGPKTTLCWGFGQF